VAAVVDPRFEVDEFLELARYMGVRIEHVFETHNHADHVSGHGRLAAATGSAIHTTVWRSRTDVRERSPIAVVCGSGRRAAVAASLVQRAGGTAIHVIEGGAPAWGRLGHPLER
jgi:glyoxylase-like metal-dependent hydrolase (beta-lactamase superfamily II)